jgi:hypothetical protein
LVERREQHRQQHAAEDGEFLAFGKVRLDEAGAVMRPAVSVM